MLNAIVSTKEISTVIEFPIDLYELYRQLNQNGVTQGPMYQRFLCWMQFARGMRV